MLGGYPLNNDYLDDEVKGNVIAGILGAFLFSFYGVALWFAMYQLGYIAGATGFIMFGVTIKGYELFGKKVNLFALIICFIISIVMIFFAELSCLAFEIYKNFKNEYAITVFDAFRAVPDFLTQPDVFAGVRSDLIMGCVLTFFVIVLKFTNERIRQNVKKNKTTIKRNENRPENVTGITKRDSGRGFLRFFWVIFTLGAFFTNWIPFLYFGLRHKKTKLLLWSIFFFAPLVMFFYINDNSNDILVTLYAVLAIVLFIMGIIHTIKVCAHNFTAYDDIIE